MSAEGVSIRGSEYVEKELQEAIDRPDVTAAAAVKELVRLGANRSTG